MVYQKDLQISLKPLFSALLLFIISVYGIGPSITFAQSQNNPNQINPSILTKTPHPKISSNATNQRTIISNTTQMPLTSSEINSSKTPHPKISSNASTAPLPQVKAASPKSITNSSELSKTPHPTVLSNSSK
ncbi:MAG TPA: hypothetical protein VE619_03425 [Nitrososphaeraceae archaeon]|nr:hypothetical protein [Nitrososphaeraceae archaeon]